MWKLFSLSVGLSLALMSAAWVVLALGRLQAVPASITQLHLIDCPPPCWIGIVPGTTSIEDAKARMLATYFGQDDLTLKDSGFASGPVDRSAVENAIEGTNFYLFVRLNISDLVDGRSETVQSIQLFTSREDWNIPAPTVADILGTFGAPQGVVVEDLLTRGSEITLKYVGLDVVFYTVADRVEFTETPRLYLGGTAAPDPSPSIEYRPWKGFGALVLR